MLHFKRFAEEKQLPVEDTSRTYNFCNPDSTLCRQWGSGEKREQDERGGDRVRSFGLLAHSPLSAASELQDRSFGGFVLNPVGSWA